MQIKIHRGTHQIGGCITEISTDKTKIFIDFGEQLPGTSTETEIDATSLLKGVNAVFFTHYHGDHVGMLGEIHSDIPSYIGKASKEILIALNKQLSKSSPEKAKLVPMLENFNTYDIAKKIVIGDITVTPFLTDHSAYDAYMLLIECDGKRILYTGDFRTHGMLGKGVMPMLKKYVKSVDVLICEGTMLSRSDTDLDSEYKLQQEMKKLKQKNIFLLCSSTNLDRIANFYSVRSSRPFVCDVYQKNILKIVSEHSTERTSFYNFKDVQPYRKSDSLHDWIERQGVFALISNNSFSKMFLEKYYNPENSVILYSQWQGYLNPKHPAFDKRLEDFLSPYKNVQYLHTSGHATPDALKQAINLLKPQHFIPIHTENPDALSKISDNCTFLEDGKTFVL